MGYGICLGGLWKPKRQGAKSAASGPFRLPANVSLDASRGHRFVVVERQKKNQNEPDFDLWLFGADEEETAPPPSPLGSGDAEDVPF